MSKIESFAQSPAVRAVVVTAVWFGLGVGIKYLGDLHDPWAVGAVDFLVNLRLLLSASPLYTLIPRPKDVD